MEFHAAMPRRMFALLLLVAHVGEAVRIKRSTRVRSQSLLEESSGQDVYENWISQEAVNVSSSVGAAVNETENKSQLFFEESYGQHLAQKTVSEETVKVSSSVGEAVRKHENKSQPLFKESSSQHVAQKRVSEETVNVSSNVGDAARIKKKTQPLLEEESFGQHVVQKRVIEESVHVDVSLLLSMLIPSSMAAFCCGWFSRGLRVFSQKTKAVHTARRDLAVAVGGMDEYDVKWCFPDAIALSGPTLDIEIVSPNWNAKSLKEVLRSHAPNILNEWKEEQVEHFANELSRNKARLAKENNSLLRVIDMIIVLVVYERDELVLQELVHEEVAKGNVNIEECTVKGRLRSNERFMECAERCLQKLGTERVRYIEIVPDILGMREERRVIHSAHPGLPTLMQYYIVEARVVATDSHGLNSLGLSSRSLHVNGCIYKWDHLERVPSAKMHLKQFRRGSKQGVATWMGISHSLVPVLPWTADAVTETLEKRGLQCQGALNPGLMSDILRDLVEGRVSLAIRRGNTPKLAFVKEKVSVVVTSPTKSMNLVSGISVDGDPLVPSVQRHASESCWRAAVRLCQTKLMLSGPLFQMDCPELAVSDQAQDQKLWEFITREHILRGPLIDRCSDPS